jgi:hypothetical protein
MQMPAAKVPLPGKLASRIKRSLLYNNRVKFYGKEFSIPIERFRRGFKNLKSLEETREKVAVSIGFLVIALLVMSLTISHGTARAWNQDGTPVTFPNELPRPLTVSLVVSTGDVSNIKENLKLNGKRSSIVQEVWSESCASETPKRFLPKMMQVSNGDGSATIKFFFSSKQLYVFRHSITTCSYEQGNPFTDLRNGIFNAATIATATTTVPATTTTSSAQSDGPCSSCYTGPTLSWSNWHSQAVSAVESASVDISLCSYSAGDAQTLYDLSNSAPDPSQTIAGDVNILGSDVSDLRGISVAFCTGSGLQDGWAQDLALLNSDLQNLGLPAVS